MKIIITHGDGDGLCAGAICYKALNKKAVILFAQPFDIKNLLENNEIFSFDEIYIIDIAFSDDILSYLECFRESGKKVVYIDHHIQSLKIKGLFDGIIDTNYCASRLVSHYFNILTPLEKLGSACDKMIILAKLDEFYKEAEILRKALIYEPDDDAFRLKIVKELAEGKMPSQIEEVVERAKKSEGEISRLYEIALKNIIYEDKITTIIDMRDIEIIGRAGGVASKIAIEKKKAVFLLYKNNEKIIITARSHRGMDINIGEIMQKNFNGGGHKYAGSGNTEENDVNKVIRKIYRAVNEKI